MYIYRTPTHLWGVADIKYMYLTGVAHGFVCRVHEKFATVRVTTASHCIFHI